MVRLMEIQRVNIMGVEFHNATLEEAVQAGCELASGSAFSYVVTPNPEIVQTAMQNPEYHKVLAGASLVLPDGIGVIHASRILRRPLKERVPGIDFAEGLLKWMNTSGKRLYLLGAKPGVAEIAAANLRKKYPALNICGMHDGYFQDSEPVVEDIRNAGADVALVCLGVPKQEYWMAEYGPRTGAKLMIGLGGVLDVYAGQVKRAPELWQNIGMEWLFRLIQEPKRINRMIKLPGFLVDAVKQRGKERRA